MLTLREVRSVVDGASRTSGLVAYTIDWRGAYYSGTTRRVYMAYSPVGPAAREVMRKIRNERKDRVAFNQAVIERESIEITESWD